MNFLSVMLGGALGAGLRYGVMRVWPVSGTPTLLSPILFVNLLGGLAMGAAVQWFLRADLSPAAQLFLTTGILGGFTTFSAFSIESVLLYQRGGFGPAVAYILLSVCGSLVGTVAGMAAVMRWSAS